MHSPSLEVCKVQGPAVKKLWLIEVISHRFVKSSSSFFSKTHGAFGTPKFFSPKNLHVNINMFESVVSLTNIVSFENLDTVLPEESSLVFLLVIIFLCESFEKYVLSK